MPLDHVVIGLFVATLIMGCYAASRLRKPAWFGKAFALLVVLLAALTILRMIMEWNAPDTEQPPIEPLARTGAPS